ncbi:MAG: hypothetical protein AB1894_29245, partial [Chloroflexota bacterium]
DPSGTSAPPMYLPPASTLVSILDPCDIPPQIAPLPPSLGYMEGESFDSGLGSGGIFGREVVYDFATMTRAYFNYEGKIGGLVASFGGAIYAGPLWGFEWKHEYTVSDKIQIEKDYKGLFEGLYIGVSTGLLTVGVGGGIGYFHSPDGNVGGIFDYVSAGIGLLPGEIVSFRTVYKYEKNNGVRYYADSNGKVNLGSLVGDILSGDGSPTNMGGYFCSAIGSQRAGAVSAALTQAAIYEAYTKWAIENASGQ